MRAAVFRGIEAIELEDLPDPRPGADDVVLAVRACGICGSDLHTYTHGSFVAPGQVMGHEFVGEVIEAGAAVDGIAVGDRVTASPLVPCGSCPRCAEGRYNLCAQAWTKGIAYGRPGAFAERLMIPKPVVGESVFKLGEEVSDQAAALIEPLAVAVHAGGLAGPIEGRTALVLGLGTIGQQVIQTLRARGAGRIIGVDLSPLRLRAAATLGAEALDGSGGLSEALPDALGQGAEVDLVFECSGAPALALAAVEHVRAAGTIVVLALYDDPVALDPTMLVQKEIRLQGSIAYTGEDFAEAVRLTGGAGVQAEPLITHREPLERIGEAFAEQLRAAESIKVLVEP